MDDLSENLLPDSSQLASQFSDIQNAFDWNQMNHKMGHRKVINIKKQILYESIPFRFRFYFGHHIG